MTKYKKKRNTRAGRATYEFQGVMSYEEDQAHPELQDYLMSHGTYFEWFIKNFQVKDLFEIHEIFLDSFERDFVETPLTAGMTDEKILENAFTFKFVCKVDLYDENKQKRKYSTNVSSVSFAELTFEDSGEKRIIITMFGNFFSDYPKNKETGKILDLSSYAPENRKRFNEGLKKFAEELGGEIYDYYPNLNSGREKDLEHKLMGEEIDKNGFKALTERADQLRKKSGGLFGRLFG